MSCRCLDRRRFIVLTGRAAAAAALPVGGCGEHDVERLAEDVAIVLSDHSDLEVAGETVLVEVDALDLPLAVTRQSDDSFIVTGTECNHRGCGVERSGDGFTCPCHGAEFDLDGSLSKGPATKSLIAYEYEVVDDVMTVFGKA